MMRKSLSAIIVVSLLCAYPVFAKSAGNRPYVVAFSEVGAPFYARCIPDEPYGSKGVTQILRVKKEGDEVVTSYAWFNRNGLVLGWSPIAGKVAVMRVRQDEGLPPEKQVEFSFYLGEKLLRSWTTADLTRLGAGTGTGKMSTGGHKRGPRAVYHVEGCIQAHNTNDYYFSVRLNEKTVLAFDVLTGGLVRVERDEKDPAKERLVPVEDK